MTLPVLRRLVAEAAFRLLWTRATDAAPGSRPCPSCRVSMREVEVTGGDGPVQVDVCRTCTLVWFDRRELAALPPAPLPPRAPDLEDPRAAAERERRRERERADAEFMEPRYWWTFLGFPVEVGARPLARRPWATWITAAVVAAVSFAGWCWPSVVQALAFVPADAWRNGGITWLTVFLVHADVFHLLGNLYFFMVFADNVEDDIGKERLLLLLVAATIAGNALHWLGDPRATLPCVGASGGIAGVLAFYALRFPQAQLATRFRLFFFVRFRAWVGFAIWCALQLLGAIRQIGGSSSVSALAHLGGAATGAVAWWWWRELDARRAASPPPRPLFEWR